MKNKCKETQKEAERQTKERKYKRDAEGRVILPLNVQGDDHFLSEFSKNNTPVISSEVAEFIENSTNAIPPKEALTLQIHSDCIDRDEQVIYSSAIKEYYMQQYIANEQEIRRNRRMVLLLGLVGILVLTVEILFDYLVEMPFGQK